MIKRIRTVFFLLGAMLLLAGCRSEEIPLLLLTGEGAPFYTIVRGDNASEAELKAALFLRKYLNACGMEVSITTDWKDNPAADCELVVGETLREPGDPVDVHSLGEEGFAVYADKSRLYLQGGSAAAVQRAVEHFLTEFFGYAGDPGKAEPAGTVGVPENYRYIYRQEFPVTGISVNGRDLREFRIAWTEQVGDYSGRTYARMLRERLYGTCGIYLENAPDGWDGPTVLFSLEETGEGDFAVRADGDTVTISTAVKNGMELGIRRFLDQTVTGARGELAWTDGTVYRSRLLSEQILYGDFGAAGDGVTDDFDAIIAAHAFANTHGLPVKADAGRTFRIGGGKRTAVIETDTDWSEAVLILDDRDITYGDGGSLPVFHVRSRLPSYSILDRLPAAFSRDTEKFDITLETDCLVVLQEAGTLRYIREGVNANNGAATQEILLLRRDGTVDPDNAIIWDYTALTAATAYPIDGQTLTLRCGTVITKAALTDDHSSYFQRCIRITRSNVKVTGLRHLVEGEERTPRTPYWGILSTYDCADIRIEDCVFTGRRVTTMGTYEITPTRTANLTLVNCTQTNDINDTDYWGVIGSNYCKSFTLEGCSLSRFDAHAGVRNVTIRNCTLGHQGLNAIGFGLLYIENTTVCGNTFINLRSDYGSAWEGDAVIRDCTWLPRGGASLSGYIHLIGGSYSGYHDFGYPCGMPRNITIDGLRVLDGNGSSSYRGVSLLGDIVPAWTGEVYERAVAASGYPYRVPESVTVSGFASEKGKPYVLSTNPYMYRTTALVEQ